MLGYSVEIEESSKELSAKERIMLKDTSDATKLDLACDNGNTVVITPESFAVLNVHNEKSDNKDYKVYIIQDVNGNKYTTGSSSFWNSFKGIYDEMHNEDTEWGVKAYKLPSKNYAGKEFLTCSLI